MLSLSDFRATARDVPTSVAAAFLGYDNLEDFEGVSHFVFYESDLCIERHSDFWRVDIFGRDFDFASQADTERHLYFYWYVLEVCPPTTLGEMSDLLRSFCDAYGLAPSCALAMLVTGDLSVPQSDWLHLYVQRWEELTDAEEKDAEEKDERLLTHGDRVSWLDVVWEALWGFREDCIPEGDPMYDEQWDNICTAMAWIAEEIGVDEQGLA